QARLAFRRGGPIQSVAVHAGDRFEKDQPLAQLDVSDLTSQAAALRARRDAAQAQLDELKSGPRTQTIAAAQAEVRRLTADVKLADTSRRRQETLNRQGATSQQNADAAKYQYQSLVAKLDAAQQKLSELEEGTRAEQIQAQTANVGVIDAELQQLEVSLNDSRIQAPFDGVVAQRFVDEGTIAGPTMPVLSVYTADEMEVRFGLPLAQSAALKAGDEVSVRLDDQRVLIAKVIRRQPRLDPATRTVAVDLRFSSKDSRSLIDGQFASITLPTTPPILPSSDTTDTTLESGASFWVPIASLQRGTRGLWSLLTVSPGQADDGVLRCQRSEVRVLETDGTHARIRGMVAAGDQFVASGMHRLSPGMAVTEIITPGALDSSDVSDDQKESGDSIAKQETRQ
ncbi:MAG: efflux RND transporter periplasmic adaptor subunit, partial [Planctomycetota bacterium]